MSDIEKQSHNASIEKIKVNEAYKDEALQRVRDMVQGNQFNSDDVVIESFEGEVLHFHAETMLNVYTKVSQKTVPGQVSGAVKVKDEVSAREEMAKAYALVGQSSDLIRKIRDVVLARGDQGFALDKEVIHLNFGKKDFVVFEPCLTCKTTGSIACRPCHGKGVSVCSRCSGSGMGHCTHCNGAQMIPGANGHKIQCPVCHGRGRVMCTQCQQSGRVHCKTCASRGVTRCPNCEGHAWTSRLFIQELLIRTAFDYPKNELPNQVVALIEKHGAKIKEHAEIALIEMTQDNLKGVKDTYQSGSGEDVREATDRGDVVVPVRYKVVLPYGHVEYGINGKSYYTFLFGTKGRLMHVSPFLDDLIKNGVRKLKDAAEGRGDVVRNIAQAAEYRTVKEGLFYTARYGIGKARKMLKKTNALGLSDEMIKDVVKTADIALKKVTQKPRYMGLAVAGVVHLALISGYFLPPTREKLTQLIANSHMHIGLDLIAVFGSVAIGFLIIQGSAIRAMSDVMRSIMPDGSDPRLSSPKLGEVSYLNIGLAICVAIGVLEYMRRAGVGDVWWFNALMTALF